MLDGKALTVNGKTHRREHRRRAVLEPRRHQAAGRAVQGARRHRGAARQSRARRRGHQAVGRLAAPAASTGAARWCSRASRICTRASTTRISTSTRHCIMVLKGCGPKGYPGMAEVGNMPLPPKLLRRGITDILRISDARMSGTAYGAVVLHVSPEAAAGGPLALVQQRRHHRSRRARAPPASRRERRRARAAARRLEAGADARRAAGTSCTWITCSRRISAPISTCWWAAAAPTSRATVIRRLVPGRDPESPSNDATSSALRQTPEFSSGTARQAPRAARRASAACSAPDRRRAARRLRRPAAGPSR